MKRTFILLLHLSYWLMYLLLEFMILMMMRGSGQHQTPTVQQIFSALFLSEFALIMLVPGLVGFYLFYTVLFNRFLARKKIGWLIVATLFVAVAVAAFTEALLYFRFARQDGRGIQWSVETTLTIGVFLGFMTIVHGVLGLVMKGFIKWYDDIKLKEELMRKNHEMELALIKSQINPHFLFNTLNNIDTLILKNPHKASEYLNKLSEIMRFMLYETREEKMTLDKELDYINKYIELQKIRSANDHFINYTVNGQTNGLLLETMLFIPFIENAFKHTENKKIDNAIRIHFEIEKDKINFECINRYSEKLQARPDYGGLGNELIRKRLQLLYPGRHQLEITDTKPLFTVKLKIELA